MTLWGKIIVGVLVTSSRATLTKVAADFPGRACRANLPSLEKNVLRQRRTALT